MKCNPWFVPFFSFLNEAPTYFREKQPRWDAHLVGGWCARLVRTVLVRASLCTRTLHVQMSRWPEQALASDTTAPLLEYRNADCRLHHIHEHDVTSSLKGKREKTFRFV